MIAEILADCRAIVAQHHQQTRTDLLRAIDAALAAPAPRWTEAAVERIALATEIPVGTVARVLTRAEAEASVGPDSFDLLAFLAELMAWQAETFGPRQTVAGVVDHIRRELIEVEANPADPMEPIDLLNLAVSLLRLAGATPDQICQLWRLKFGMLQARTWPDWRTADSDRAIEHDRSAEPPTQPEGLADFGLLVSFPDQSPSFVHGFEAGMIWMDLRDSADPFDLTMHSANRVLATRIASHHGWNVTFRATEFEEWTTASFARGSRPALTSIDGGRAATPQEPR